jgi:hypothetical protein
MCCWRRGLANRSRYASRASSPITSPSRASPSLVISVRCCCRIGVPAAKRPPILRLRLTGPAYVFLGRQRRADGLGRTGEMGRLQEPRKLSKPCASSWLPPDCWQSTAPNGPASEVGDRETWNISITDRGEPIGSTEGQHGDQGDASRSASLVGEGRRPVEERTKSI